MKAIVDDLTGKEELRNDGVKWFNPTELEDIIRQMYLDRNVTKERQKTSFSPSTVFYKKGKGVCPRYWHFAFNGTEFVDKHDADTQSNFETGIDVHESLQAGFKEIGLVVEEELAVRHDDPPIFGYVDNILLINDNELPVELKSCRAEAFEYYERSGKASKHHEMQLLIYMYILNYKVGAIVYKNKNDGRFKVVRVLMHKMNKDRVENALDWMRAVYAAYENDQLPKRRFRKNSKRCDECPVMLACDEAPKNGDIDIDPFYKGKYKI